MKIGIITNNQIPIDQDMVTAVEEQFLMVRLARDRGWDSSLISQHYLSDGTIQQMQQVPLLARMIGESGEMTTGVAIFLLNLHNPVYVAETMASLDILAKGNFVFGIGLGYRDVEFDAFRVPKGTRVRRFEEALTLVKRLWTEEAVTFENDVCKLDQVRMNLRPVQKPHPPIWMAANADNAVKRAARMADCWYINPHATLETNTRQMELFKAERRRVGLPMPKEVPCRKEIFCAKDRKTAMAMVGPFLEEKYKTYARWGQDDVMPENERLDLPFEELVKDRFVIGTPEDCYAQLRPYWEQLGVTHFIFRIHFYGMPISSALYCMRMISDELLPALRKVKATPLA
ncbi:MAG: LLM class flavin-dependent oxidoreductase [Candidatus Lambdaproteobacteria bacterium]|nr:LLM class flavin-dependent oxidoreductase [Candidatus Lambdaproteobacteria bacterium]